MMVSAKLKIPWRDLKIPRKISYQTTQTIYKTELIKHLESILEMKV